MEDGAKSKLYRVNNKSYWTCCHYS